MIGLKEKEPKERRKVGLIVMLLTVRVVTSLVVAPLVKRERNILHVALLLEHVRKKDVESLGVKTDLRRGMNQ